MKICITALALLLLLVPTVQAKQYSIKTFEMNFLLDAPLEKIKGNAKTGSGQIYIDENNLKLTNGQLKLDVSKIKLHTFLDESKNKIQTSHMKNWFEAGKFKNATINITKVKSVSKSSKTQTRLIVDANFTIHGVSSAKVIELIVTSTPQGYTVQTAKPFNINLKEHNIKPRDLAGRLLTKTLQILGQKVAEEAQVSVSMTLQ